MSAITYTTTINAMGDADESDCEKFAAYVEARLADEFQGAEINVMIDNRLSGSQLSVSDDLDIDYVRQAIQGYWDRGDWANA